MKQFTYYLAMATFCIFFPHMAAAQGMAVNTSGSPAVSSAILDVSSTDQGMLVPRMNIAQRNAISSPVAGLLIYQTDGTPGFYYYSGTAWSAVGGGGTSGNSITNFTNISAATYTVLTTDQLIYSSNASTAFTLPTAAAAGVGKTYYFITGAAAFANNSIKVATSSGNLIYSAYFSGGVSNSINGYLNAGFGGVTIVSDGVSKWYMTTTF